MVTLDVADSEPLRLVLDTGTVHSAIGASAQGRLLRANAITESGDTLGARPIYRLGGLSIEGQLIPDLNVVVSNRATMLGIDGMLGLNFLALFSDVHFSVDEMRVTLTRRD